MGLLKAVTMQSLGFRDIPALLALDKKDLVFFLNRFARGFHSKVRPTRVRGPLGDLSKLSWRMGARVKLTLASKEVIEAETILPPAWQVIPDELKWLERKSKSKVLPLLVKNQ